MRPRQHDMTLVLALFVSMAMTAGCASEPKIPEESQETSYDSAREEQSSSGRSGSVPTTGAPGGQDSSNSKGSGMPKATGPIAHVNGEPISAERFNEEIQKVARTKQFSAKLVRKFQSRLIDRLIDRTLIERQIKQSSVKVNDKEIDEKLEQVRTKIEKRAKAAGKKMSDSNSLDQLTQRLGISGDELRDSIRQSIAIEKLLVQKGLELPSEKDVRKYYKDNKSKFKKPERIRARHIFAQVKPSGDKKSKQKQWDKAKKRIDKIHEEVTNGADFAEVARNQSDGKRASSGGDLGFASRAQMKKIDPKLAKATFSLQKGEISDPIKTRYGWHILKAVDRQKAEVVPYDKVKSRLREQLKNRRIKKRLQSYVQTLRSEAEIEKHPDNIE